MKSVRKITPQRQPQFDQQFWPVIVALTVLCGIAVGAIITLARGPWLWGSLLLLPLVSALTIWLLYYLDDSKLRRSLQLSIIVSLALHLLIMVGASVVNIFDNPFQQPERTVAQRPERTIQISNRRANFVWEETNHRETPEPEVATQRENKQTTSDVKPQPVPLPETKPVVQPQLTRRETPAQTVPHQDQSLSQLRRQTQTQQLKSSVAAIAEPARRNESQPQPASKSALTESAAADSIQRQSTSAPTTASSRSNPTAETKQPTSAIADSKPTRAIVAPRTVESSPQSSPSSARRTAATPSLPIKKQTSKIPAPKTAAIEKKTEPQPSPRASEITRRPTPKLTVSPAAIPNEQTSTSPQPQIARSIERRQSPQTAPSITSDTSRTATPRRSTTDVQITASPVPIEKPSRQPDSQTASQELNSKTLSVSRSTAGISGAGRSANLETATGGMTSPATRASDSAARRETESAPTEIRQLTSSQSSVARRAAGVAPQPTSAFTADTTAMAKISGSTTPTDRTVESSAARIDSATADHRGQVSVEKGNANVDLGPTKVVVDSTDSTRRSGGGQPEISQLNPETTQRSRSADNLQPSLVADTGVEAIAPSSQSSAPVASEIEPNAESTTVARAGGEASVTVQRDAAMTAGEFSNAGETDLATALADSRERATRADEMSADFTDDDEDDEEDDELSGNESTRVSLAPVIKLETGFGNFETALGNNTTHSNNETDTPSESLASTVSRTAMSQLPGSGIGRSATSLMLRAATSLPVIESTAPRRDAGETSIGKTKINNIAETDLATTAAPPTGSTVTPKLSEPTAGDLPATPTATAGPTANYEMDASEISIARPESNFADQGARMEVIAMEGPAGLADRPSESLGVMTRPASLESQQIQPDLDNRFRSTNFGGVPAVNPDAVLANEAFRKRSPAGLANAAEPTTEAAIQLGLEFLARYQTADGSWSLSAFDAAHPQHANQLNSDSAATALAILAFQGAGYNHREFKYARVVNHGVLWLVEHQLENGSLYVSADKKSDDAARLYSHGIAALALTEAYGMTQDIQLKAAAQKAIDYIIATQDPRKGGWRYQDDPKLRSTDTSVTGWMMMALHSGRLAGLDVDPAVFNGIDRWLDAAADPDESSQYRYNPYAMDTDGISRIQGRQATASMTSVGLLMRIYSGVDRNDSTLLDGATFLTMKHLPSDATPQSRDTYYWYYATQVLKHIDGPLWEKWDAQLRPLLIRSQQKTGELSGSWHPYNPVPDRWGSFGGRLYVTTMNLLSLEVRHRMLPLYQKTNEE